jgi:hypothetical protein
MAIALPDPQVLHHHHHHHHHHLPLHLQCHKKSSTERMRSDYREKR